MTQREPPVEKHTRLALKLLDDAGREISSGDLIQGSEKLWGATSQAIRAYCASRCLPHSKYSYRQHAILQLADQTGDDFLNAGFGVAESCHGNFYNDWLEQEHLDRYLPVIQTLVEKILEAKTS